MDSAAIAGTEFLEVVVIIFKQFGWCFAVGLCSCTFPKYLARFVHSENFECFLDVRPWNSRINKVHYGQDGAYILKARGRKLVSSTSPPQIQPSLLTGFD